MAVRQYVEILKRFEPPSVKIIHQLFNIVFKNIDEHRLILNLFK